MSNERSSKQVLPTNFCNVEKRFLWEAHQNTAQHGQLDSVVESAEILKATHKIMECLTINLRRLTSCKKHVIGFLTVTVHQV